MATIPAPAGAEAPTGASAQPSHIRRVLLLWVLLSLTGIVLVILFMPAVLPAPGSDLSRFSNTTITMFAVLSVPVAMFVWVFVGYSIATFRVKGRPAEEGPPLRATAGVQIGWLAITGALCLFLVVWGLVALYDEAAAAPQPLIVNVTGQQWSWTFSYPQYNISRSHVLEIPVDRPVQFNVTSADVLHGFSIEELGVRIDANPGETVQTVAVTPDRIATYFVRCMELCGRMHSNMEAPVHVVKSADFAAWAAAGGH